MAANDAWILDGMNGGLPLTLGQTFTGLSRGLLCAMTGDAGFDIVSPTGSANTVSVSAYPTGGFIKGPISEVVVASGIWIVYPDSLSYTVA